MQLKRKSNEACTGPPATPEPATKKLKAHAGTASSPAAPLRRSTRRLTQP
jgi:hypothetical protein